MPWGRLTAALLPTTLPLQRVLVAVSHAHGAAVPERRAGEGPETRRSDLDSLEYAVWMAARDDPALWEAGATAMLDIAVICFCEDEVRTLVLRVVERFGEAAL